MLRNSTNIPDKLVAIMVAFAMPPDCSEFITSISVKNKRRGKIVGKWGYYYGSDQRVVVIVPRAVSRTYTFRRKWARTSLVISSRAEFLVAILAHEMRHAWQAKHWNTEKSKWKLERDRLGKYAREADCEHYELMVLDRWKRQFGSLTFND